MDRSSDHGSESDIDQAKEHEHQDTHEGIQNLECWKEVWQSHVRESYVGKWSHGPGDTEDEHDQN